jgi:L,D-transpeptidase catalytic domain
MRGLARAAIALLGAAAAIPAAAEVFIAVNKSTQRMSVSVDGAELHSWPVSTGTAGYATPTGAFTPVRLARQHRSREWNNAPMPHSIFFTDGGHAIHGSPATGHLGAPASHGCVRLSPKHASTLFDLVQAAGLDRTRIEVTGVEPIGVGLADAAGTGRDFRGLTSFDPLAVGIMAGGSGPRREPVRAP